MKSVGDKFISMFVFQIEKLFNDNQPSAPTTPAEAACPVLKPKPTWPDKVATVDLAEACLPTSLGNIHHTGIPAGVACKRSRTTTQKAPSFIFVLTGTAVPPPMWETCIDANLTYAEFIMERV